MGSRSQQERTETIPMDNESTCPRALQDPEDGEQICSVLCVERRVGAHPHVARSETDPSDIVDVDEVSNGSPEEQGSVSSFQDEYKSPRAPRGKLGSVLITFVRKVRPISVYVNDCWREILRRSRDELQGSSCVFMEVRNEINVEINTKTIPPRGKKLSDDIVDTGHIEIPRPPRRLKTARVQVPSAVI